jgi:N2-citryl-N6-acetyl-N6-hydroxylysine synthase
VRYGDAPARPISDVAAVALIADDPAISGVSPDDPDGGERGRRFMARVIDSMRNIDTVLAQRGVAATLAADDFITAEQGLLLGHPVHPTPKSRDEFSAEDNRRYAPEFGAAFALHWFAVTPDALDAASADPVSATEMLRGLLRDDPDIGAAGLRRLGLDGDLVPLPVHPWQVARLRRRPDVQARMARGEIQDLGPVGSAYQPTSSLRTLYAAHARHMVKVSISVRLTNSIRVLRAPELARGRQMHRLLTSDWGQSLAAQCPSFHLMTEPAHAALRGDDGTAIPESFVVLRTNPFRGEGAREAVAMATLCQDSPTGEEGLLARIVRDIASRERWAPSAVARGWFQRFLDVAVRPVLIAHGDYGLLFSAHQQNTVLKLADGWPDRFYFRDCQGTAHSADMESVLARHVPEIIEDHALSLDGDKVNKLLTYYVVVNNVLNVVASLAMAGLAEEADLVADMAASLRQLRDEGLRDNRFLDHLLASPKLASKANFLTCFRNINETGEDANSVAAYAGIANPLPAYDPARLYRASA